MRVRREDGEAGVSLVELLVVMVLLGVVGGIVVTAVVTTLQAASRTNARVIALNELEIAGQRVVRDLRAAQQVVITSDPATAITLVVFRDDVISPISYLVDADGRLVRQDTGQVLITIVDNDFVTEPVFNYFDAEGRTITCTSTDCSGLSQIGVRFVRGIDGRAPVVMETRATVRNFRYGST